MSESNPTSSETAHEEKSAEEKKPAEPDGVQVVAQKKKDRGLEQLSLRDYQNLRAVEKKKAKQAKPMPAGLKILIAIPVGAFCLFGAFTVLYLAFRMFAG